MIRYQQRTYDGFTLPLSRRAITACVVCMCSASLFLGEAGTGARLDYRRRQRELVLKGIADLFVFRTVAPGGEAHVTSSARRMKPMS
jgi:hypothetical protein